jgi:hypothetical protein
MPPQSLSQALGSIVSIVRESRRVQRGARHHPAFWEVGVQKRKERTPAHRHARPESNTRQSRRSNSLLLLLCSRITLILRFSLLYSLLSPLTLRLLILLF